LIIPTSMINAGIKIDKCYSTYVRGDKLDIFMRNARGHRYVAQVWPGATSIPDFLHPKAQEFWPTEVAEFFKVIPFDGLWLDTNEPANFCGGPTCYYPPGSGEVCPQIDECCMICENTNLDRWDDPPYHINSLGVHRPLYAHTMAMNCEHYNGIRAYDTHNVYGFSEGLATYRALKEVMVHIPTMPYVVLHSLQSYSLILKTSEASKLVPCYWDNP
jgi:alpha-D-xyloside xylohydrolase